MPPDGEHEPPTVERRDEGCGRDRDGHHARQRRPDPVGAVDRQARLAPHPGGDELVYGRVDGRVLLADATPVKNLNRIKLKKPHEKAVKIVKSR
jgi:hypothetical protein